MVVVIYVVHAYVLFVILTYLLCPVCSCRQLRSAYQQDRTRSQIQRRTRRGLLRVRVGTQPTRAE